MTILIIYVVIFIAAFYIVKAVSSMSKSREDFTSLKTVTLEMRVRSPLIGRLQ